MPYPTRRAAFCALVCMVLRSGPNEQMRGIYAGRSIAPMQDLHTFRDRSAVQFIGDTVRANRLAVCAASYVKKSVSVLIAAVIPKPTSAVRLRGIFALKALLQTHVLSLAQMPTIGTK